MKPKTLAFILVLLGCYRTPGVGAVVTYWELDESSLEACGVSEADDRRAAQEYCSTPQTLRCRDGTNEARWWFSRADGGPPTNVALCCTYFCESPFKDYPRVPKTPAK